MIIYAEKNAFSVHLIKEIAENVKLADILDVIFNFSKRSMMTECHHPESWVTMSVLEETIKKKTLYPIPRSIKKGQYAARLSP